MLEECKIGKMDNWKGWKEMNGLVIRVNGNGVLQRMKHKK